MADCIIIPAWGLVVSGILMMLIGGGTFIGYVAPKIPNENIMLGVIACILVGVGCCMIIFGIVPYLPHISIPCFEVVP
jgi:hypothetical protein